MIYPTNFLPVKCGDIIYNSEFQDYYMIVWIVQPDKLWLFSMIANEVFTTLIDDDDCLFIQS